MPLSSKFIVVAVVLLSYRITACANVCLDFAVAFCTDIFVSKMPITYSILLSNEGEKKLSDYLQALPEVVWND